MLNERDHVVELDGLRAIAVLAVFLGHWGPAFFENVIHTGSLGVRLFFVLSGFLITSILVSARDRFRSGSAPLSRELFTFYARRTLRIFPPYYAVIVVAALMGLGASGETLRWNALYLTNFYVSKWDSWPVPIGHLWSLAVEEQFYLLWPLVVLLVPKRYLLWTMLGLIVASPLFRGLITWGGSNSVDAVVLLPGCLDALVLGGLLSQTPVRARMIIILGGIGLFLFCLSAWARYMDVALSARSAFYSFGIALCSYSVIGAAVKWRGSDALSLLRSAPLVYLGRISYGLYLYHVFIAELVARELRLPWYYALPANFLLTLALAALSWRFFEAPLVGLKRHLPYGGRATAI